MARGFIRGTHHLTFCVGGAQEDYDFHVRLLGLKSVKKTVLFDGEIPIYHLYYGNGLGDPQHAAHGVPLPPGGMDGQARHQPGQALNLSMPADALGYWADRLSGAGIELQRLDLFGDRAPGVHSPVRYPVCARGRPGSR